MNINTIIISLFYYVGIASCAAQGAEKGKYKDRISLLHYAANAFGGGFVRDAVFLGVFPWILTPPASLDLVLVIIIGSLYTYHFLIYKASEKQYNLVRQLVVITDAFGLGSFICIGMDKAFSYSDDVFTIIVCGYVTATSGGILASGKSLTKIFKNKETVRYHLITLLGCCHYYTYRCSLCVICFVAIGLFLISINYSFLYPSHPCYLVILYPAIYDNSNNFQRKKVIKTDKIPNLCPVYSKIYLVQQRLRQC